MRLDIFVPLLNARSRDHARSPSPCCPPPRLSRGRCIFWSAFGFDKGEDDNSPRIYLNAHNNERRTISPIRFSFLFSLATTALRETRFRIRTTVPNFRPACKNSRVTVGDSRNVDSTVDNRRIRSITYASARAAAAHSFFLFFPFCLFYPFMSTTILFR